MSDDLTAVVDGIVHEPTQTGERGLDLTLAAVYEVETAASVDFGGDEWEPAEATVLEPRERDPEDDYGWYSLDGGRYLVEFNESLSPTAEGPYWLQTRTAVRRSGAFHPSLRVRELPRVPFVVGGDGIDLKENARISTLFAE